MTRPLNTEAFWQRQVLAETCTISIATETDEQGFSVSPKQPVRTLDKGSVVVMTGGDDDRHFMRLGPDRESEKVSIMKSEAAKIIVE
jgi:hypothetical protein